MEVGDDAYERKGERKQDPAGGASDRNADKILGNPLGHSRAKLSWEEFPWAEMSRPLTLRSVFVSKTESDPEGAAGSCRLTVLLAAD